MPAPEQPYTGKTSQDIINIFHDVAENFNVHYWNDWIEPAGLAFMAMPHSNRSRPYPGPKIEELPNLSDEVKAAILASINNI